jgi:hypothetical protein
LIAPSFLTEGENEFVAEENQIPKGVGWRDLAGIFNPRRSGWISFEKIYSGGHLFCKML